MGVGCSVLFPKGKNTCQRHTIKYQIVTMTVPSNKESDIFKNLPIIFDKYRIITCQKAKPNSILPNVLSPRLFFTKSNL